jgi:hypothetical protein
MTQQVVVPAPRKASERAWVFQLKPGTSEHAKQLGFECQGRQITRMSFVCLKDHEEWRGLIAVPAYILLAPKTVDAFEHGLKAALTGERMSIAEEGRVRELMNTIRSSTSDMLQPFLRHLWREYWQAHGGLSSSLTWAHGPLLLTHLARCQRSEAVKQDLIQELLGEGRLLKQGAAEWYGAWFWPNIVALCHAILARGVMESVLGARALEPLLKPLERVILDDGNLPLGITRESELLLLTA